MSGVSRADDPQVPPSNSNRLDVGMDNGSMGISFSIGDPSLIGMYWYETESYWIASGPTGSVTMSTGFGVTFVLSLTAGFDLVSDLMTWLVMRKVDENLQALFELAMVVKLLLSSQARAPDNLEVSLGIGITILPWHQFSNPLRFVMHLLDESDIIYQQLLVWGHWVHVVYNTQS